MKMRFFATAALAVAAALSIHAANPLPMDPEVRTGTLPNGLTYYLRHNDTPKKQVDLFLAQRVGSVNEEESQRGLAHFLEHMCFNGTRHFPGNSLISYLETLGVKFGANLNAYTSTDETVYNICKVPSSRSTAIDSCLLILRDWSHDLLLNDKDIDEERGVIEGEWRQRQGAASSRLLEKAAPEIYAGSIYGQRLPIGLMSVVKNFKSEELRNYYNKWYHPVNQAVIVVGDINPDSIESRIRSLWADIAPAPEGTRSTDNKVPANDNIIATVQTDPEQATPMLHLYIKHDDVAAEDVNTIAELRRQLAADLVGSMLAERFDLLEQRPDAPFSNLGIGDMHFLLARTQQALLVRGAVKPGKETEAMRLYGTVLKQAARHGFTDTELQRAKIDARAKFDSDFAKRETTTNTQYARKYVRHYLDGGALPSAEQYYKMMKGVINHVKLDDVNAYIREVVGDADRNVVMIAYLPEGNKLTGAELVEAYKGIDRKSLPEYVDEVVDGDFMANIPAGGSIVKEETVDAFGSKVWTLSNGVRVHLRHNDANPDQVLIQGYSPGGISQNYDPANVADYHLLNDVLAISSYGGRTTSQMRKLLAGKNVRSDIKIDNMRESMGVATTPGDMETAFQVLYLKATDLQPDTMAFRTLIENRRMKLSSQNTNPTFAMGDSIHAHVYGHHPLGEKICAADLDNVSYSRIMDLYRDRFGDMTDFTFYVTGNFDEDSLRTLACRYLASLPAAGRMEKPRDIGYRYARGRDKRRFTCSMEVPQSICYTFYNARCPYTLENVVSGHILGALIQSALRQDLREKRGWTYGVKAHAGLSAGMNGDDPASLIMPVYIKVAPENADATFEAVAATVDSFGKKAAIAPEEIQKVKQNMLKDYADNADDNVYWITVLHMYDEFGQDMHNGYKELVEKVTPASLARFAKKSLLSGNRLQLEMAPAN